MLHKLRGRMPLIADFRGYHLRINAGHRVDGILVLAAHEHPF